MRRLTTVVVLMASVVGAAAAGMQPPAEQPDGAGALPCVQWAGHETGREEKGFVLVQDAAAWRALWAEHAGVSVDGGAMERHAAPKVNFDTCVVLAHFSEPTRNTDGEVVRELVRRGDELVVRYESTSFGTMGPGGGAIATEPWGMWVLPRMDGPIVVELAHLASKTAEPMYREVWRGPAPARPAGTAGTMPTEAPVDALHWWVWGTIVDEAGRPLEGVEVVAHAGEGTLFETGRTATDEHGMYLLRFGPGMWFSGDGSWLQAATISPRMPTRVEKNLHRQGDLLMARREPDAEEEKGWGDKPVVLPNRPQRVNFIMIPGASVQGRLVDGEGRPIAGRTVLVDAEELPPSSSVLASVETDEAGRFRFDGLPAGEIWFEVGGPGDGHGPLRTKAMDLDEARMYEVELSFVSGRLTIVNAD